MSSASPPATAPGFADLEREPLERERGRARLAPAHVALAGVLALSAVLNVNKLSQNGYANIFYSAGVKSMLRSWHNFLFVSFDPGGLVTVDKPPLALWVQALSAKIFGFSPLSLLLGEAIIGVLAVAALYWVMAPRFGAWAAVAGALTLAVFPSFVAVSRENGVDPLLILLLILACGAGLRACETGRWRTLVWCGVLIGLAFNTKTLAAYLVVPPIALAYLVCAPGRVPRRICTARGRRRGDASRVVRVDRLRRTHARLPAPLCGQLDEQHRARPDVRIQRLRARGRPGRRPEQRGRAPRRICARRARTRGRRRSGPRQAHPARVEQRPRAHAHAQTDCDAKVAKRIRSRSVAPPARCGCSTWVSATRPAGCFRSRFSACSAWRC